MSGGGTCAGRADPRTDSTIYASRPTAIELAVGDFFGVDAEPATFPGGLGAQLPPLEALERVITPALERPPCVVSFSGGRDSSCVLAAAVHAARREGLEPPIPTTLRFPTAAATEESSWQELVVEHLGLRDWEKLEVGADDADWIGPLAAPVLRRHGLRLGANSFLIGTVGASASGGSLLTGIGGDQLFGTWRWRSLADVLAGRRRPRPYDLLRLGFTALPPSLRVLRERRRFREFAPHWIRPEARPSVVALAARQAAEEPVWWQDRVRWRARRRDLSASRMGAELMSDDADLLASNPLIAPGFVAALASAGGRLGFGDRSAAMLATFADVLPPAMLTRTSKAAFGGVMWGRHSRRFAEGWDGSGIDTTIVDAEALQREWLSPHPNARSALLLQSAWLASEPSQ